MSNYQKTNIIKIYRAKSVNWRNEDSSGTYFEKNYLFPKGMFLWGYVRQIVADSTFQSDVVFPSDRFLVVVNRRTDGIDYKIGDYIEWKDKTLKVIAVDLYEDKGDIKLTCQLVVSDSSISSRVTYVNGGKKR